MATGTIKTVNTDRGFGFISRTDNSDIFFHVSGLVDLEFSERLIELCVSFDERTLSDGRFRAVNIRPASFAKARQ